MSEGERRRGFSLTKFSHPSGFRDSEFKSTINVRFPSAEILVRENTDTNINVGLIISYDCCIN